MRELCVVAEEPASVLVCARECSPDSENTGCEPGHACVDYFEGYACSPFCQDDLCCPDDDASCLQGCRGTFDGDCFDIQCTDDVECPDPNNQVCDTTLTECFPVDGECRDERPQCPDFGLEDLGVPLGRGCNEFCRIPKPREALPSDLRKGTGRISVTSPQPGDALGPEAIEFRWEWEQQANEVETFGVVLTVMRGVDGRAPNSDVEEMKSAAIWTAGGNRDTSSLKWSDGVSRKPASDSWLDRHEAPPQGEPLYLAIVGFDPEDGELKIKGYSDLIPFQVGSSTWAQPDDPCSDPGQVLGQCRSPRNYMICERTLRRCKVLCLSDEDCDAGRCGSVSNGVRYCD